MTFISMTNQLVFEKVLFLCRIIFKDSLFFTIDSRRGIILGTN